MSEKSLPYYERNLGSYADHIICFVRQNREGHWRAVLDCGLTSDPADPDFASHGYGRSMEEAAKRCADVVRADALGIGKFAPHSVLVPGYELHFKLMRHWAKKERFEELGYDPNHMVKMALTATERDQWKMRSGSLIKQWDSTRIMEFEFQLLMAEGFHWIREKDVPTRTTSAKAYWKVCDRSSGTMSASVLQPTKHGIWSTREWMKCWLIWAIRRRCRAELGLARRLHQRQHRRGPRSLPVSDR